MFFAFCRTGYDEILDDDKGQLIDSFSYAIERVKLDILNR